MINNDNNNNNDNSYFLNDLMISVMLNLRMFCYLILEWPVIFPDNMFKLAGLIKLNIPIRNQTFFNNK